MQIRRILSGIIITTTMLISSVSFSQEEDINIVVNNQKVKFDVPPQIQNGRTLVPLRAIFEILGARVEWDARTGTITGTKEATKVVLKLNSTEANINGKVVIIDVPATSVNGRTLVPARFISESLGMDVNWESSSRSIIINNKNTSLLGRTNNQSFSGINFINSNLMDKSIETNPLFMVKVNGKYGFIDASGKIIISPRFDYAYDFEDGLACIRIGSFSEGLWGYINKNGDYVYPPQFNKAYSFSEGLALISINEKWSFIDKTDKYVLKPQQNELSSYSEGLAKAFDEVNKKVYFYNKKGDIAFEVDCEDSSSFHEGMAWIKINGKYGYINAEGEIVIKPQYDWAMDFAEGLAAVGYNDKYQNHSFKMGFVDTKGNMIIKPQFKWTNGFSEGLAFVTVGVDEKGGFIDKSGNFVIQPTWGNAYELLPKFIDGISFVEKDEKYGFINLKGEVIIEPQFTVVENFRHGLALIRSDFGIDSKFGYINIKGEIIWNMSN